MSRLDSTARAKAIELAKSIIDDIERVVPGAETSPPYLRLLCSALLDADEDTRIVDLLERGEVMPAGSVDGSVRRVLKGNRIIGEGPDLRSAFRKSMKGSQ